jgi:acetolactate synthase-1/2/3 large subunit
MQNADLLLILGSSMGAPVIGYDPKQFSPQSYKIQVDLEEDELNKNIIHVDEKIQLQLNHFFRGIL